MIHINQFAIKGEEGTGYEGPNGGRFSCDNCQYFSRTTSSCGQKDMMAKSKRPKLLSGRIKVDARGCCEYIERIG